MPTLIEVGKPFPGAVPTSEGATLELKIDGPVVLIQMPGLTRNERQAFKKSFKTYSYLETDTPVPIAFWIFNFPGPIDCNFNAKPVATNILNSYLDTTEGLKNLLTFYLLDDNILQGIKAVGLQPRAVELFHATIQKQLSTDYTQADYDRYLSAIFQYSTDQLGKMCTQFRK
ncbi:MAG: hypothetical protein JRD68_09730 [Deltaproteobacteria bacterium]|nr:hypothetical protein [Deltaproteobacteria bacterium]